MLATRPDQYAEDRAEVEVLFAKAKKHADLGRQIQASLSRMRERDAFWKQAKDSLYSDTKGSRAIEKNVHAILDAISRARQPLEGKGDEERVIRDRPQNVGLRQYLASLRRAQSKHSELVTGGLRINVEAAQELGQLLSLGEGQVVDMFESLVRADVNPVEPLHYTTKKLAFPLIPEQRVIEMGEVNAFVFQNARGPGGQGVVKPTKTVNMYVDARSAYMASSLQSLALATISTAKTTKPDELYSPGTNAIGMYTEALRGMLSAEWKCIGAVFAPEERPMVLSMTADKAVQELSRTLGEVETLIRGRATTQGVLAFELIDNVSRLAFDVESMTGGLLKRPILDTLSRTREFAKDVIRELVEDIRRRLSTLSFLPKNSAALPATSDTVRRLGGLVAFPTPLASILTSIGDRNWMYLSNTGGNASNQTIDVGPDGNQLIGNYIGDTLEVLCELLDGKGRALTKDKASHGLFLANNVSVIDSYIRSSDLSKYLAAASRPPKLDSWRKKGYAAYSDAWRSACGALMDVQYTNRAAGRPQSGGGSIDSSAIVKAMDHKQKDVIKKKFDQFNMVFGELIGLHKEYMPAMQPEVKGQLGSDIQTMIQPLYGRFWDRYHEVDKGKGKHVRYDKGSMAQVLEGLSR